MELRQRANCRKDAQGTGAVKTAIVMSDGDRETDFCANLDADDVCFEQLRPADASVCARRQ